jgi:hypothetical protein
MRPALGIGLAFGGVESGLRVIVPPKGRTLTRRPAVKEQPRRD